MVTSYASRRCWASPSVPMPVGLPTTGAIQLLAPRPAGPRLPRVYVRPVTAHNVREEVAMIRSLLGDFPFVAVDTEYPGAVHAAPRKVRQEDAAEELYKVVKANVDELHLLQLGITLCDGRDQLPIGPDANGGMVEYAWEVNFSDFDAAHDRHAPDSVAFLRAQGFDFDSARRSGVTAEAFARELDRSGILGSNVTWITYGGLYDAAYLLKTVTGGEPLPKAKVDFLGALGTYLGGKIFDTKYLASLVGVEGSLKAVARALSVPPLTPARHSAGPNSVVTCHAFMELRRNLFPHDDLDHLMLSMEIDGLRDGGADQDNIDFVLTRLEQYAHGF